MTEQTFKVLLVDDHPIVREGLDLLISKEADLMVCGHAEDVGDALRLVESTQPDVAVIDISLASGSGLDLIRQIRTRAPQVKLLVSSMHDETLYAERALQAGALGYINKQEATGRIIEAIHHVLEDRIFLSDSMSDRLLHDLVGAGKRPKQLSVEKLSDRELEVLSSIGNGLKTAEIAERMNLSVKTVETYRQRIRHKLKLESGAALASFAAQWVLESS